MSILRHSIHIASKQVYYLFVFASVLLLAALGTTIWLSEAIEERKDEVADWAGKQIGYPVEIGSTDLYWLDLVPKLHVNNMKVLQQDRSNPILELEHIYLGLDLIASFQQGQAVLKNASLTGLGIGLTRTESGQFQLTGLPDQNTQTDVSTDWYQWFSLLKRFELNAITIEYQDLLNTSLSGSYQLENASVSHQNELWNTTAKVQLPETIGQSVVFNGNIEISAESLELKAWQWQLKTDKLVLPRILNQIDLQGIHIEQGSAAVIVKARGEHRHFNEVNAELSISDVDLSAVDESLKAESVSVSQLSGQFTWQHNDDTWSVTGRDVLLDINNEQWPKTNFEITRAADGLLVAETDYLRLSHLSSIALLSKSMPEELRQQKPAGDLSALRLEFAAEQGVRSLAMTLKDFSVLPWQDAPGVSGLTAKVDWRDGVATVDLDSHQLTLYPEKWLEEAVFFDSATGQIRWQQDLDWQIEVAALQLWNDDFTLQLDGKLSHENGATNAALVLEMEQVEVSRWKQYVPQSILDEDFKEWANPAFVAGKVIDGSISLKGDLAAFPFESKPDQGQFDMNLNVADVQLHYAPDWPDLVALSGRVTGKNNQLTILSKQGNTAGFNIAEVETIIEQYIQGTSILTVDGFLTGRSQQALDFLKNSPLEQRFGTVTEVISAEGESDIKLALMVPLSDTDKTEANGYVSFKNSQVTSPEFPELQMTGVNGKLFFDNNGVSAKGMSADLLGQAVNVNILPESTETLITITGNLAVTDLNKLWPNSMPDYLSGQTGYQAQLSVHEKALGEFEVDVAFESDLKGINIELPAPLGKTADQSSNLSLLINHHDEELAYTASYSDVLNAVVIPDVNNNWRGEIRLGKGKAVLPKAGLAIKGQIEHLSLDDWIAWQEQQVVTNEQSMLSQIDTVSMNINQLDMFEQEITDLAFTAERAAQDWRISLHSKQVKGNVNWPLDFDSSAPLSMDFDYLYLKTPPTESEMSETSQQESVKSDLWPSINFHTRRLHVDDMKFGEINLLATRHETSWDVDAAILKSDTISASVKGQWQQLPTAEQSHFKLTAASDDFRGLLADLGYQQVMEAESVDIKMDLSWPNSPLNFSRDTIVGQLTMDVGKGRMIEVEPGAAGRIFGLLSVASIPRRLALDFTDLFGEGFNFDSIKGSFGMEGGVAYTDDLSMFGQSALIEVEGPINIVDKTYDQKIKITPNVSSTLPVAGAAVGGPIGLGVGTAILVFDKLVGELFDKEIVNLISYSYKLTGPWDEPELNIINPISK